MEVYRRALVRHGVPHQLVNGSGIYQTNEVADIVAILVLVENPADENALAQDLRGPFVNPPDRILFHLPVEGSGEERLPNLEHLLAGESQVLRDRFHAFRITLEVLCTHRERLGLTRTLQYLYEQTSLLANTPPPFRSQSLANYEKLLALAWQRGQESVSLGEFALELAFGPKREPLAEVEPLASMVTLCTVHQAKGLEWPVVVLADLEATPQACKDNLGVVRGLPVAVNLRRVMGNQA